jgi:hypothetical protein
LRKYTCKCVKILEVWVVIYLFQKDIPAKMLGQLVGQRGFAGSDVADDGNVHNAGRYYLSEKGTSKVASAAQAWAGAGSGAPF